MAAVSGLSASTNQPYIHRSWIVYATSRDDVSRIQREVDKTLDDYSFYPEVDWVRFGYRPPEGYQVLGAWRHPHTKLFVFLLDNPRMMTVEPTVQLLLYVSGEAVEVGLLEPKLIGLKAAHAVDEKRGRTETRIGERLDRMNETKHLAMLTSIIGVFTAIINGFALYLQQLPPPQLGSVALNSIYQIGFAVFHFFALGLLLLFLLTLAIYIVKYAILLLRRL